MLATGIFLVFIALGAYAKAEMTKCEKVTTIGSWRDENTVARTTLKTLSGTWISEGCETRPGPEYVLRAYTFNSDGSYHLIQHHYWDDSCSSPKLTIISYGKIQLRNSLVQPEAANGIVKAINITVIPHGPLASDELNKTVKKECSGQNWKSWKHNEEYLVYENSQERGGTFNLWSHSYQPITNHHPLTKPSQTEVSGNIACLGSLKWAFNELKLLKIQFRPLSFNTRNQVKQSVAVELLLGDIHSNRIRREFHAPTSFQVPLIKLTKGENIAIDGQHFIVKNTMTMTNNFINSKIPPHLIQKAHLPPLIWGEWTSTRCEIRPLDVYLLRRFSFNENTLRWVGEHKFFSDPFCTYAKFIITATGHFEFSPSVSLMRGVTNIDFQIEQATLTALDFNVITDMRLEGFCGVGEWKVREPKELAATNGCIYLGLIIPSVQFDIIKIEMDYEGSWLLFMGQVDTNNMPSVEVERPTAFQLPLVKCGEKVSYSDSLIERLERKLYFTSSAAKSVWASGLFVTILLLLILR